MMSAAKNDARPAANQYQGSRGIDLLIFTPTRSSTTDIKPTPLYSTNFDSGVLGSTKYSVVSSPETPSQIFQSFTNSGSAVRPRLLGMTRLEDEPAPCYVGHLTYN